jgi:hypothetical protein
MLGFFGQEGRHAAGSGADFEGYIARPEFGVF